MSSYLKVQQTTSNEFINSWYVQKLQHWNGTFAECTDNQGGIVLLMQSETVGVVAIIEGGVPLIDN